MLFFYKDHPLFTPFTCIFFVATWYNEKKVNLWGADLPCGFCLKKKDLNTGLRKGTAGHRLECPGTRWKQHNSASSFSLEGSETLVGGVITGCKIPTIAVCSQLWYYQIQSLMLMPHSLCSREDQFAEPTELDPSKTTTLGVCLSPLWTW